jgi:hypothetical protein
MEQGDGILIVVYLIGFVGLLALLAACVTPVKRRPDKYVVFVVAYTTLFFLLATVLYVREYGAVFGSSEHALEDAGVLLLPFLLATGFNVIVYLLFVRREDPNTMGLLVYTVLYTWYFGYQYVTTLIGVLFRGFGV